MIPFIDLAAQQKRIKPQIDEAIQRVLQHGSYVLGPEVAEVEQKLASYVGVKHCVTVSSGTDSLLIAMMALGIQPGDEVITVPFTWISTAETIALLGAKPVFVDVDDATFNLDPSKLEAAINSRTKAIMPVGIFGQTANMQAINSIADQYGLPVIEDAAQCFGATHHGVKSCSLSTIGSTSFFPSKPLGCYGDGGALFTSDDELAEKFRYIRVHGQERKHYHPMLGVNGRMDTLQAAILMPKLEIFDDEITLRQQVADTYGQLLSEGDSVRCPQVAEYNTSVWAQYTIRTQDRDGLCKELGENGIPSVSYYAVPLHLQPVFSDLGYSAGDFPVAEAIANDTLSLPMSPYLAKSDIDRIASVIRGVLV